MKHRRYFVFSLVCLLCLLSATASAANIKLQWGVGQGGAFLDLYKYIADLFEERNPNVEVEIVQAGYDQLREKVVVAHVGGAPIDIFEAHSMYLAELAEGGIIADLGPYISRDADIDLSQHIPVCIMGNNWKGKQVGLTLSAFMDVMYLNRTHYDEAGVRQPTGEWTWDDFAAACRKLSRDTTGDGVFDRVAVDFNFHWGRTMPFVFQAGGQLFDDTYSHAIIDSEPAIEALTFLQDLQLSGCFGGGFMQGRTSMYITGPWDLPNAIQSGIDFDVALMPKYRFHGTRASNLPIHMSSITSHPEEAWALIKFMISPEIQMSMNQFVDWVVPSHIRAAQQYVKKPGPPEHKTLFLEQMLLDPGHQVLSHPAMPKIGPVLQGTFNRIRDNAEAVRPALQEANRTINALMQEVD